MVGAETMENWLPVILILIGFGLSVLVGRYRRRFPSAVTLAVAALFVVLSITAASRGRLALLVMAAWMIDRYFLQRKLKELESSHSRQVQQ